MVYPEFSRTTRSQKLSELLTDAAPIYDAVVVGGGIVGAGLLRELSIRGINALLVEKGDFASGTSSKSSKLIHGGLRYLEMFDFGLVFEALSERHWLLKTHPHLVQPLEFVLPLYAKGNGPIGARSSAALGLGLWLYDALSLFRTPFFHGKHSSDELKELFPGVRLEGLKGGYYYADAMMLDDELVLEVLLDAVRRGASALNYVMATKVEARDRDGLYRVHLKSFKDQATELRVRAREVIVCVGPWTETIGDMIVGGSQKKLRPSRGVHLVFDWNKLPVDQCLVMYAPDGRIVFAIPRKDLGSGAWVTIVGTTDAPEHREIENVEATREDVDYLFKVLHEYFPDRQLRKSDVMMTYAGVRPLLDDGAESEAKTSREHEIWRNEQGVVFMAGGKYTTFRKISEEIADFAFPRSKSDAKESKRPLSTPEEYAARFSGAPLWGRFTEGWVQWKLRHHSPVCFDDVVFRRMPLWLHGKKIPDPVLRRIEEVCGEYWVQNPVSEDLRATQRHIERAFSW